MLQIETSAPTPAAITVRKISICIVSHAGYGAVTGGRSGHVGGVERQTSLLASWLAERGHDVSFATWDEGGEEGEVIGGVRCLKICRQTAGFPVLRFFYPRWSGLVSALRRADADVYYQNCGGCPTGQIALWCKRHGKPFVYSLASDAHCDPDLREMPTFREKALYRYGLKNATRRVAQTELQKASLRDHFAVDSQVIEMPAPGPSDAEYSAPAADKRRVLWVGRVCKVKRPDRLLKIAAACPDVEFVMAGPVYNDEWSQAIARDAEKAPNIRVMGAVAREEISNLYRDASLLCCTSDYEGFPNTFLEAWSHGLPIISTVDPDGLLSRCSLGRVGQTDEELSAAILELLSQPDVYSEMAGHARARYLSHHSMEAVMPRFENMFLELARDH